MPAMLVPAAAAVAVIVMMPAAAAVAVIVMMPAAAAVIVLVFMLMFVFVTAAFAVFAALAVLMFMLMLVMMLMFHKNLPNVQWLLNRSTNGRKKNARSFAQMIQTEVEDLFDMLVGKGVEYVMPLATEAHKVT